MILWILKKNWRNYNCFQFFSIFYHEFGFLVDLWMNKLIQGVQTHNGPFKNARNDKQTKKNYQIFLLYLHFISFDSDIWFFNNDSWIKSMLRVHTLINRPKKGISKENIGKKFLKIFYNFSNFLKKSQGFPYEIFWLKVTLDIKMSNPRLYINH